MKVTRPMHPWLPYHVMLGGEHRIVYLKPTHRGNVFEWRDWFTDASYGIRSRKMVIRS